MASRLFRRRSATAAGLYAAVAFGILGTVVAANVLGLEDFGVFATTLAVVSFFQTLLDLTVEEALTKYGFRYVAQEDWGRLRRLFRRALELKLVGGVAAGLVLLVLAFVADVLFDSSALTTPLLAAAFLPVVQSAENVGATALLLRGRYDLRGAYQALSMALRFTAIAIGVQLGVWEAVALVVVAQAFATLGISVVGRAALRRFPSAPQRSIGEDRREIVFFVIGSSLATGVVSLRTTLAPIMLGLVSGTSAVGLFRVATAPQTGLTAATSPVRLVLLTEQTRDWEYGRRKVVMAGIRRYSVRAAALMALAVPVFYLAMPWLVRTVFRDHEYGAAVDAARIVLFAGAIQVVLGWTKSLPTTIGKPRLRVITHGIEVIVLLPLVAVLGAEWGVTGTAVAVLVSTGAFAVAWIVALTRIHADVALSPPRPESAPAS